MFRIFIAVSIVNHARSLRSPESISECCFELFEGPLLNSQIHYTKDRFGSTASIKFDSSAHRTCASSYLFNSNPTITIPTATANHISATLLVAVMAPPATTGPTTALSE